jgi:hypothetical protein
MTGEPGPMTALIWQLAPGLPPVTMGDLDGGPAEATAAGFRRAEGWLCCLCGKPAVVARVIWPAAGAWRAPVWADLCPACWAVVRWENTGADQARREIGMPPPGL